MLAVTVFCAVSLSLGAASYPLEEERGRFQEVGRDGYNDWRDIALPAEREHHGIYFELPAPSVKGQTLGGGGFASRPWEPAYGAGADAEANLKEATAPASPTFDRGQPEVGPWETITNLYHEKRDDEEERIKDILSEEDTVGPIAMARVQHSGQGGNGEAPMAEVYFIAAVAGCSAAFAVGLVASGMCWYRLRKSQKAAAETAYPAYGVTGPNKTPDLSPTGSINGGDRKLAQSAQMYHYQHQKQQMIAMEANKAGSDRGAGSDAEESDEEHDEDEGQYTVYECPGLAPTGEMEVRNPLFDDPTPVAEK